jgi:hypothetical protein
MSIVSILIVLVICGVGLYLLEKYVPMHEAFRTVIRVVVILFLILLLLSAFGIINLPSNLK